MSGYRTKDDRIIQLMLLDPRPHWPSLCKLLGADEWIDDARFADNSARQTYCDELAALIGDRISARDWAEWEPIFYAWDAPWELIRTIFDVTVDPQAHANEMLFTMDVNGAPVQLVSGPATFDGHAKPIDPKPSPGMGEHTDALLTEVGYSADKIADMKYSSTAAASGSRDRST